MKPFEIHVPDETLEDLRDRLARTRWTDEVEGAGWDYGTNLAYLKEIVGYWQDGFDWRKEEAKLGGAKRCASSTTATPPACRRVAQALPRGIPARLQRGLPGRVSLPGREPRRARRAARRRALRAGRGGRDAGDGGRRGARLLVEREPEARSVTSVCTGSLVLGAAGLLRGYRAATHLLSTEFLETCTRGRMAVPARGGRCRSARARGLLRRASLRAPRRPGSAGTSPARGSRGSRGCWRGRRRSAR
jgi:Epoxide hydrolase N terminus